MPLPTLHINDIPEEGLTLDAPLDAPWLASVLADSGFAPRGNPAGEAHVRLDLRDRDVLMTGSVDAHATGTCVSCLAELPVDIHAEFTLNLEPARPPAHARGKHHELELTADELDVDTYENDRIDLGHWVREQILLELPAHPRCPDGCREPIHQPTTQREEHPGVDPRLAPLQHLSEKKKE